MQDGSNNREGSALPKRRAVAGFLVRGVLLATIATLAFGTPAVAQPFRLSLEDFPDTGFPDTGLGEPYLVMYDDGDFLASASYRYSQRNHDSAWLVVHLVLGSPERVTIRREDIVLVRPDGLELVPATRRERRRDLEGVRGLLNQRANWPETVRFNPPRDRFDRGFYRFEFGVDEPVRGVDPFGAPELGRIPDRTVRIDAGGGMRGDVFFVSPDGSWEADVHALVVTIDDDRIIKLPVWLR